MLAPDTWQRYERTIPKMRRRMILPGARLLMISTAVSFRPAGPNPAIKVPPVYNAQLSNGIPVLGAVNAETPTSTISLRVKAGQEQETMDQLGVAALTAAMLDEATEDSTAEDLSNRWISSVPASVFPLAIIIRPYTSAL